MARGFDTEPAAAKFFSSLIHGAATAKAHGDCVHPIRHVHGALAWGMAPPEDSLPMGKLQ